MEFKEKYADLLLSKNRFDILEGTTFSGKTTFGAAVKFMFEVAASNKRFHGIAGDSLGVVEKNIINAEVGILSEWGDYTAYRGNGSADIKIPHIVFRQGTATKIIYVFGYDDRARWKKVLGGQLGCLYVDEANIADVDFLEESAMRCEYMLWTLNPDSPDLPVYEKYINHSRPLPKYKGEYPAELLGQLDKSHKPGYAHWYCTFDDNIVCTPEKKQQITESIPLGSKRHKNKILGLRGYGEGMLYAGLLDGIEPVSEADLNNNAFEEFVIIMDRGKSVNGDDPSKAHTVLALFGFTKNYRRIVPMKSKVIKSIEHRHVIEEAENWIYPYWLKFYGKPMAILIDNALGDLITTWQNHSRWRGKISVMYCIKTVKRLCPDLITRAARKCQLMMKSKQHPTSRVVWCDEEMLKAHNQILQDKDGSELDQGNIWMDYADCFSYAMLWRIVQIFADEREQPKNAIQFF